MEISRNEFIKTLGLAGFTVLGLPPVLSVSNSLEPQLKNYKREDLTFQFLNPPTESQSWVWWRWLNGAASKKGITTDLEAMHDKGIGGAVVFDSGEVDPKVQNGPPFMGDEWRELFKHALREADRLGIVISVNVCSGWNAGGAWVTPEYAGKMMKATPIIIKGPKKVHLPPLQADESAPGGSGIIAILAMPVGEKEVDTLEIKLWDATSAQDLTSCIDKDGSFEWESPAGSWMLLKMEYQYTRDYIANPGSGPAGLEIDRYSAEAMDLHFSETGAKLAADAGPLVGNVLQYFSIDSLEGHRTTWTGNFREEFINRRGYDPLMELPAVMGYRLADEAEHRRFIRDYNQTCADLLADNFYRRFRELTLKEGLKGTTCEAGLPGSNLVDPLKCLGIQDVPMSEFWKRQYEPDGPVVLYAKNTVRNIKLSASAAHTYGKRICQAEAFTSLADNFTESPWAMKDIGDSAFCDGLTRMVFSSYVAQVDHEKKPGIFWDHIGIDLSCNMTWWPMAEGWLTYLARCQHMLSQGLYVADFAYLMPDLVSGVNYNVTIPLPGQFDYMNSEVLLERASVRDGRLVLPDGMSYRYLCMPKGHLESGTIKRITELIKQGLQVIASKQHTGIGISPDKINILSKDYKPDVVIYNHPEAKNFKWIHRRDGETDIYFISNQSKNLKDEIELKVTFRVKGKQPELWDPVTGEINDLSEFEQTKDGRITVLLIFAPRQSFFLVFKKKYTGKPGVRNFPELKSFLELTGEWKVEFDKKWFYGKDGEAIPNILIFQKLEDWTSRPENAVKYYSGIAIYKKLFDLPATHANRKEQFFLDLGNVKELARVRLNGRELGIVWTAPWRVEVPKGLLKATDNKLEIEVANLWPNRLIGDGLLSKDQRRTNTNISTYDIPLPKKLVPTSNWARGYCGQCKERLESGKPAELLPSGLLGPVRLMEENPD